MTPTILIHGFATGLDLPPFRPARGANAGFLGFGKQIENGGAKPFRWDERESLSFWKSFSPFAYLDVYRRETKLIRDEKTHAELDAFLALEQPRIIVCHSMGCALLLAFLERHALPASVRHVVFVQADIPRTAALPSVPSVSWHNLFCPWDPTLLVSSFYHRTPRAGQTGLRDAHAQNHLTPLLRGPNLHTASIRNPNVAKWIDNLAKT